MSEYLINKINSLINIFILITNLSNLNKQKLTDITFIKIINMILKYTTSKRKYKKNLKEFVLY